MTELFDTQGLRASNKVTRPTGNARIMTDTWRLVEDATLRAAVLLEYANEHLPAAEPGPDLPDDADILQQADRLARRLNRLERDLEELREELDQAGPLMAQLDRLWAEGRFGNDVVCMVTGELITTD